MDISSYSSGYSYNKFLPIPRLLPPNSVYKGELIRRFSDFPKTNATFVKIENKADGNCLFESVENGLIQYNIIHKHHVDTDVNAVDSHKVMRKKLCEFYAELGTFIHKDKNGDYIYDKDGFQLYQFDSTDIFQKKNTTSIFIYY